MSPRVGVTLSGRVNKHFAKGVDRHGQSISEGARKS